MNFIRKIWPFVVIPAFLFWAEWGTFHSKIFKRCELKYENWSLTLKEDGWGVDVESGRFGEIEVGWASLFQIRLVDESGKSWTIDPKSGWRRATAKRKRDVVELEYESPAKADGLTVKLTGVCNEDGIAWSPIAIDNIPDGYSIAEVDYPTLLVSAPKLEVLTPDGSIRAITSDETSKFHESYDYPKETGPAAYFAFRGEKNGLSVGVRDKDQAPKTLNIESHPQTESVSALFFIKDVASSGKTFVVPGEVRWQAFDGDFRAAERIARLHFPDDVSISDEHDEKKE